MKKIVMVALIASACLTAGTAVAADGAEYYYGPFKEPVCNRHWGWDLGLLAFGVSTVTGEKRIAKKAGDWTTDLLQKTKTVRRAARALSVVGWASLATEGVLNVLAQTHLAPERW